VGLQRPGQKCGEEKAYVTLSASFIDTHVSDVPWSGWEVLRPIKEVIVGCHVLEGGFDHAVLGSCGGPWRRPGRKMTKRMKGSGRKIMMWKAHCTVELENGINNGKMIIGTIPE
jgi:hypothetical protein